MRSSELKAWMDRRRWTNAALAEVLAVHPNTVGRWRNGYPIPRTVELAIEALDARDREGVR